MGPFGAAAETVPIQMTRGQARFLLATNLLVVATGIVWAWMLYLLEPADEFAVVNHPWQPTVQAAHVLAAPLLLWAVAAVWRPHAWKRLRSGFRPRRRSGLVLMASFWPMAASGWLYEVSVAPALRDGWRAVHLAASAVWTLAFVVHLLAPRGDTDRPTVRAARP